MSKNYSSEYFTANTDWHNRDGLFFSLFNKMIDPHANKIPHVLLSRFDLYSQTEEFYQVASKNRHNIEQSLLLFNLNPLECPLVLLEDFLHSFKPSGKKLSAHYHYQLDLSLENDQQYLLSYFRLVQKYLGELPATLTTLDLEKFVSFEKWEIVEGGTQWSSLDNYFVHLVLSKGGNLYLNRPVSNYEVLEEKALSPHHSLQKIKIPLSPREIIACDFAEDLKSKNFYKHPEDLKLFYYMIYKNIFL
jgi:hypothetical protein